MNSTNSKVLSCRHKFHSTCIERWCRLNQPCRCPLCRATVRMNGGTKSPKRSPNYSLNRTESGRSLRSNSGISSSTDEIIWDSEVLNEISRLITAKRRGNWVKLITAKRKKELAKSRNSPKKKMDDTSLYYKYANNPAFKTMIDKIMSNPKHMKDISLVPMDIQKQDDKTKCYFCNDKLLRNFTNSSIIKKNNKCPHCKKYYCYAHIWPEHHGCIKIDIKHGTAKLNKFRRIPTGQQSFSDFTKYM